MRYVTLSIENGSAAAVLVDGGAVPVDGYRDVQALIADGDRGRAAAELAVAEGVPQAADDLLAPVLDPGAVVCVGLNYRTHILEMGRELPQHPTLFSKLPRALIAPHADVVLPADATRVDYEGELAVVIGRGGRGIPVDQAWDAVAGLTVMNDITMRDFQKRTLQWFAGKTWQASTPWGPCVVTKDELPDVGALELRVTVNGEERQRAEIGDLVFDVPTLVSDLSRIVELRPGDVIATGTPGGVGEAMEPKGYLQDGDLVEVSISGIGTLRNRIRLT